MLASFLKVVRKNFKWPTFRTLSSWRRMREQALARKISEKEIEAARQQAAACFRARLETVLSGKERLSFQEMETPEISIIIVLFNQAHLTLSCLEALARRAASGEEPGFEIVLVDNGSSDETAELLELIDGARVIRNASNAGFPRGCNQGAEVARGRVLLLLNNDAVVRPGALAAALATLDGDETTGAVGGRLILPGGKLQEAGSIMWSDGTALGYGRGWQPERGEAMFRRDVDFCSGALLMTPLAVWRQLGGLDEGFSPAYYEDVDYCFRLWERGLKVVYEPDAVADHFERGSEVRENAARALSLRNQKWFRARHAQALRHWHWPRDVEVVPLARAQRRTARRSLLVVDTEVPLPSLGQGFPRAQQLLDAAFAQGWKVCVLGLHQDRVEWARARRDIPKEIELIAGRSAGDLSSFLDERRDCFDVIVVSRPDIYRLFREAVRSWPHLLTAVRIVYDAEALFSRRDIARAALTGEPVPPDVAAAMIDREIASTEGADAIVCVSDSEAAEFRRRTRVPVHRLGHAITVRHDTPAFPERQGFLFVGRLLEREAPNFQGLAWFIREVWPTVRAQIPGAVLTVAGHLRAEHDELIADGVSLVGPIDDLACLYDASRVFVAPIRFAAGIPIKIIEASAAGLPCVTTSLLAEQLGWQHGRQVMACDTPESLAQCCITLHGSEPTWTKIRGEAQRAVELEHGVHAFRLQVARILEQPAPNVSEL